MWKPQGDSLWDMAPHLGSPPFGFCPAKCSRALPWLTVQFSAYSTFTKASTGSISRIATLTFCFYSRWETSRWAVLRYTLARSPASQRLHLWELDSVSRGRRCRVFGCRHSSGVCVATLGHLYRSVDKVTLRGYTFWSLLPWIHRRCFLWQNWCLPQSRLLFGFWCLWYTLNPFNFPAFIPVSHRPGWRRIIKPQSRATHATLSPSQRRLIKPLCRANHAAMFVLYRTNVHPKRKRHNMANYIAPKCETKKQKQPNRRISLTQLHCFQSTGSLH